jgi:hypothetical protein
MSEQPFDPDEVRVCMVIAFCARRAASVTPGAVARKEARKMPAEAARAAGYQNMLITQFEHRYLPKFNRASPSMR